MKKMNNSKILFMTYIVASALIFSSCIKNEATKKNIKIKFSALNTELPSDNDNYVYAISGPNKELVLLDSDFSAVLPKGKYEFQTVSFEDISSNNGKTFCGRVQGVNLSRATKDVSMDINEENCKTEPFITLISQIYTEVNSSENSENLAQKAKELPIEKPQEKPIENQLDKIIVFDFKTSAPSTSITNIGASFINKISGTKTNIIKLDSNNSSRIDTGTYEFQAVVFENSSLFTGKKYCGKVQAINLKMVEQSIPMFMTEENCLAVNFTTLISTIYQQNYIGKMVMTWKTDNGRITAPTQITLPLVEGGTYNFEVNWGDGQKNIISNWDNSDKIHNYATPGTYTVSLFGIYDRISFVNYDSYEKIIDISQWGHNKWKTMESAFDSCYNLQISATDSPDLSEVTNMSKMFIEAKNFNSKIGHWDTSNVQNMSSVFYKVELFNQDISQWNTSSVTDMSKMFYVARAFNQSLANWNTSSVITMRHMFASAIAFNQDIGSWNTSSATDMYGLFYRASGFNQDISKWNTSSVTDMSYMFNTAIDFDQDLHLWDVRKVVSRYGFDTYSFLDNPNYKPVFKD